jgi:hypothetical protein
MTSYFIGLDLGQKRDFTALALLERIHSTSTELDRVTWERKQQTSYQLRYLERFPLGLTYPEIVARVARTLSSPKLTAANTTLVVDATGVGAPVVDMLRAAQLGCEIVPVTITAGDSSRCVNGTWRVPKRDLISGLQVMLEQRLLRIAAGLAETSTLMTELSGMRVEITASANDTYGAWRNGAHDDLVFATALATWRAWSKPARNVGYVNKPLLSF